MRFEALFKEDQRNISKWRTGLCDSEYFHLNRELQDRIKKLISKGVTLTGRDCFIIAMIYHHRFQVGTSRLAVKYANMTVEKGYEKGRWLIASATDRLLQLRGKPQKFGTQIVESSSGNVRLYRTDPKTTDNQRRAYGLPSLKELKRRLSNE